jgi:hypothetical protein
MVVRQDQPQLPVEAVASGRPCQVAEAARPGHSAEQKRPLPAKREPHPEAVEAPLRRVAAEAWPPQRPAVVGAWAHQVAAARPLPEAIRPRHSAVQKPHLLPAKPEPPETVEALLRRVAVARPLQVEAAAWVPLAAGQPHLAGAAASAHRVAAGQRPVGAAV